jgi:hypothetical protein
MPVAERGQYLGRASYAAAVEPAATRCSSPVRIEDLGRDSNPAEPRGLEPGGAEGLEPGGPDAAECEKDHHRRRRPTAGANRQVTPTVDTARPSRATHLTVASRSDSRLRAAECPRAERADRGKSNFQDIGCGTDAAWSVGCNDHEMNGSEPMDQIEVEGLRIAYERVGVGPPLVLAHGFVATAGRPGPASSTNCPCSFGRPRRQSRRARRPATGCSYR